jgi:hypothetical protein
VFAVATPSVRPGVLLEELDQVLATAEDWSERKEAIQPPGHVTLAKAGKGARNRLWNQVKRDEPEREAPVREPSAHPALDGEEVDKVALSREFAALLQEASFDDEEHQ